MVHVRAVSLLFLLGALPLPSPRLGPRHRSLNGHRAHSWTPAVCTNGTRGTRLISPLFAAAQPDDAAARQRRPRHPRNPAAAPPASPATPRRPRHTDLLERELDSLRQRLARVRSEMALLSSSQSFGRAGTDAADGSSSAGGDEYPAGAASALQRVAAEEQQLRLEVAVVLQQLNAARPDGGSRLREAEEHYRAVLSSLDASLAALPPPPPALPHPPAPAPAHPDSFPPIPGPSAAPAATTASATAASAPTAAAVAGTLGRLELLRGGLGVRSNLAALLLEAERPGEALRELRTAMEQARELQEVDGSAAAADGLSGGSGGLAGVLCGLRFNSGKALAALGRVTEADAAYGEAAVGALGLEPGCFAKAVAAMSRLPDDLLPLVRGAVSAAEESGLTRRVLEAAAAGAGTSAAAVGGGAGLPPAPVAAAAGQGNPAAGAGTGAGADGGSANEERPPPPPPHASSPLKPSLSLPTGGADGIFGDRSSGGWLAGIGPAELSWLHFALAKALDERTGGSGGSGSGGSSGGTGASAGGEAEAEAVDEAVEEAWRVLLQANALQSALQPYDPSADWRQLATLTAVFRAPLLRAAAAAGAGLDDPTPVFVVGMPRSGSTLVETMLASHPGVWGAGEDTAMAPLTPGINDLLAKHGLTRVDQLTEFGRRYLAEMRRKAEVAGWPRERPPQRIVDKMLKNLWLLGYIQLLLPRSCLVHVARHPLDAALSCFAAPFGYAGVPWAWRLEHVGEQVRLAAALVAHWRQQLPPGRLMTLHYEELVAYPEVSARRLLSHCGLDWQPGVLAFHTTNRTVATASVAQVRQPLYNRSVGRWVKYARQLAPLAQQIAPELAAYEVELAAALRAAAEAQRKLEDAREAGASAGTVRPRAEPGDGAAAKREAGNRRQHGDLDNAGSRSKMPKAGVYDEL